MSDIQEQIKLAHKRAEENDIKLLKEELEELKIEYRRLADEDAWEIADYKSRNEKAILFIDNYLKIIDNSDINMQIIKDILQGVDKE